MSIPAARAIKRGRPDAHVTVLAKSKLVDLWKTVAEVDDIIQSTFTEALVSKTAPGEPDGRGPCPHRLASRRRKQTMRIRQCA